MSSLNIGIVEDELVIARTIINNLEELGYPCCGPAINYTEALELISEKKPDLLLLDITLSGKKDGIDLAQKINELYKLPFIFLTANSDALTVERAKAVRPHAYIIKPFTQADLFAAIEIAFSNFTGTRPINALSPSHVYHSRDFMFVKDGYVFRKVFFSDIFYLESDSNYVIIHLKSQKKIMARSAFIDFISQFDPATFLRVHRSFAVNLKFIDEVFPTEISVGGCKIPVGRSYQADLHKALGIITG